MRGGNGWARVTVQRLEGRRRSAEWAQYDGAMRSEEDGGDGAGVRANDSLRGRARFRLRRGLRVGDGSSGCDGRHGASLEVD